MERISLGIPFAWLIALIMITTTGCATVSMNPCGKKIVDSEQDSRLSGHWTRPPVTMPSLPGSLDVCR
jgi:hypothetical protein